MIYKTYT